MGCSVTFQLEEDGGHVHFGFALESLQSRGDALNLNEAVIILDGSAKELDEFKDHSAALNEVEPFGIRSALQGLQCVDTVSVDFDTP